MAFFNQNSVLNRQLSNVSQRSIAIDPQINTAYEFWTFLFNEINIIARSGLISVVNTYTRFHRSCFNLNFKLWNWSRRFVQFTFHQTVDYLSVNLWPKKKFQKIWLKNAFNHMEELHYDEVRWFVWKDEMKQWVALKGHDSIRLEIAYYSRNNIFINKDELARYYKVGKKYVDFDRCAVLGGFYSPNEDFTFLVPIYWNDVTDWKSIRRGTWFDYKGKPLDMEISELIEKRHLSMVNWTQIIPAGLNFDRFSRWGALKMAQDSFKLQKINHVQQKVVWTSMVDIYIETDIISKQQNSFFNFLFSKTCLVDNIFDLSIFSFSAIVDLLFTGAQIYAYAIWERFWNRKPIRRGYLLANFYEGKPSVDHLIFVIHGIGHRGDVVSIREHANHIQHTLKLIDNADKIETKKSANKKKLLSNVKDTKKKLQLKNRHSFGTIRNVVKRKIDYKRPKAKTNYSFVIPIEWRSVINIPEETLDLITPITNIRELRRNIHFTLMDVMYYMSPEYQNEIITKSIAQFNEAYHKFMNYNPKFNGSISIIGHSLGSVITYDIMTDYEAGDELDTEAFDPSSILRRAISLEGMPIFEEPEKLAFKIDNAFLLGSPVALFLIARGEKYQQAMLLQLKNPKTKYHIYNIIHPLDPISYRIEPLFHPIYSDNTPEPIFPCYSRQAARIYSNSYAKALSNQNTHEYYYCATDMAIDARRAYKITSLGIPKEIKLQERLDFYVLPILEEMGHWSALANHSSYWSRTSIIHFIRNQIYFKFSSKTRNQFYSKLCCSNCSRTKKWKHRHDISFLMGFHFVNIIIGSFFVRDMIQGNYSGMEKAIKYLGINYSIGLATYFLWPIFQDRQMKWLLNSIFMSQSQAKFLNVNKEA